MDSFKYVQNQTENEADIYLFDQIGGGGINASDFVNELRFLDSLGLSNINIHINSPGGSVMEGFGIFSAIRAANTHTTTIIDGIAASIAGIIAMAGNKRTISDFGRLMIHDPHFGNGSTDPKQQKVLDTIKSSLITILTNNSILDEGEVFNVMTEETWFNSEEALAFGFVDSVFSTKREKMETLAMSEVLNIAKDLFTTPINNNTNQKNIKMINLVNHLGLDEKANETEILDAVKVLENKVKDSESTIEANTDIVNSLNETIEKNDNELCELKKVVAVMTVENAISEGKVKKENKEELILVAVNDLEAFKTIVNSVEVAPVSITNLIQNEVVAPVVEVTFNEMSKNSPNELHNLLKNDPTKYVELYKKQFGVEPKI